METTIKIPKPAEEIIERLNSHGFEAYVVGGCVRDSLLGKAPQDWDITTSARPQEVKRVFGRTIDTGIAHGTVTIMRGKEGYEVTTYRIDGEYEDGRHPKDVFFTSNLEEDLKRRDFTINAMAYHPRTGLIDIFQGIQDLEQGRIRCVGSPQDRFTEDALRILRAVRFSAQLGFDIEPKTREAIKNIAPNLVHISKERIQMELTKLLLSDHPDYIKMVFEYGIASYVSQTFSCIAPEKIFIGSGLPSVRHLRWAAFLKHQAPKEAKTILKQLKLDNDTIARTERLVHWWNCPIGTDETSVRKTMSQMPPDSYDDLLILKESIQKNSPELSDMPESREQLAEIKKLTDLIRARGDCVSLKTLAITGTDLLKLGMKPGKAIGDALNILLETVLEHPEWNKKEDLIKVLLYEKFPLYPFPVNSDEFPASSHLKTLT